MQCAWSCMKRLSTCIEEIISGLVTIRQINLPIRCRQFEGLGKGYNPHLQVKDAGVVPLEKVKDGHQVVHHLSKCPKHIFFDIRISHQMIMLYRYLKKYVIVPKALMQNFYARKALKLLIFVKSFPRTIMSFT